MLWIVQTITIETLIHVFTIVILKHLYKFLKIPSVGSMDLKNVIQGSWDMARNHIILLPRKFWFILSWEGLGEYTAVFCYGLNCVASKRCIEVLTPNSPECGPVGAPWGSLEVQGLFAMFMCAGGDRAVLLGEKSSCPMHPHGQWLSGSTILTGKRTLM